MSADEAEPATRPSKRGNPRRTSGAVREAYLQKGAFLIEFAAPSQPRDMFGGRLMPPGLGPTALQTGKERQSAVDQYRTMERKGFRVTKDTGCLIPDEQYATYQQGATVKGHQRSFAFFGHWVPKQDGQATRNEFGWPMNLQISHVCHRRSCCRIDHILAEEQWRNLKRNFCGASGRCDCGNETQCLRRYQMDNQTDEPAFCETAEEVKSALVGAPTYVIHGANRFEDRDRKSGQRKKNQENRKRRQALHKHTTERKQARLGTVDEEVECESELD
jgi:Zinc-binding loop region of homing endonuclease